MYKIAEKYLNSDKKTKHWLMDYYNVNCYNYIPPNRRYKIKYNDNWCAMFTSVIAHMAGIPKDNFPYEVSVRLQRLWAKERGLYYTNLDMVEPNDLIIYDWNDNGTYDHVGIVIWCKGGNIRVIEGNKHDRVDYRTIKADSKNIDGFIKIYAKSKDDNVKENEHIERLVSEVLAGKHGTGLERIKSLGNYHYEVQRRINERLGVDY